MKMQSKCMKFFEPKDDAWATWKNGGQSKSGFHTRELEFLCDGMPRRPGEDLARLGKTDRLHRGVHPSFSCDARPSGGLRAVILKHKISAEFYFIIRYDFPMEPATGIPAAAYLTGMAPGVRGHAVLPLRVERLFIFLRKGLTDLHGSENEFCQ
jgi:hypothetical protein